MHDLAATWSRRWGTLLGDRRCAVLAIVLLWAMAYLPAMGVRDLRLEEGRRATPAREMLQSGNFVVPTLYGDVYLNKPPLYFWLVAGLGQLRGQVDEICVRLPSALGTLLCALITFGFARRELDRLTRGLAALCMLTCTILLDKGTLGEIDALLTALVGLALLVWYEGDRPEGQSRSSWLLSGVLLGVMALMKGPGGPFVFYLTIVPYLVWQGRWRRLLSVDHALCIAVAALPVVVWVALVVLTSSFSMLQLLDVWQDQLALGATARCATGQMAHVSGWRYLTFPVQAVTMILPWGLFLIPSLWLARTAESPQEQRLRRYLVVWLLVPALVCWLWPTARPRYVMALVFPGCLLAAMTIRRLSSSQPLAVCGTCTVAVLISLGSFVAWTMVMPRVARNDPVRQARAACSPDWNQGEVAWTTRTFWLGTNSCFNLQFYLAEHCRALHTFQELPKGEACSLILTPVEFVALEKSGTYQMVKLANLPAVHGGPEALVLARAVPITLSSRARLPGTAPPRSAP